MEDKHNKLDRFLRRHLNDTSENQNWNVPDDAIFEKALRTVANEKKKKRKTWLLIPLFILSGLAVNEYLHNRQIQRLEGKINHLEDSLAIGTQNDEILSSALQNRQEGGSTTSQIISSVSGQDDKSPSLNTNSSSGGTSSAVTSSSLSRKPNTSSPNSLSTPSNAQAIENAPTRSKSSTENSLDPKTPTLSSQSGTQATTLPTPVESLNNKSSDPSSVTKPNTIVYEKSNAAEGPSSAPSESTFYCTVDTGRITLPLTSLDLKGIKNESSIPSIPIAIPANLAIGIKIKSLSFPVMRYGVLVGANQSWLTMNNIPPNEDAYLHDYENSQPGTSLYGFVNKSISSNFSLQSGVSYQVYQNKSILESQFLFDSDYIVQAPNGDVIYQTQLDLVNPLGDYMAPLEFRVTDEMEEEDVLEEYTTIEQTLQSIMMDLQVQGTILTANNLRISLGTGLGLAYRSGLKNTFNVSTYHNNILQKTQTEAPAHLTNVRRWYVQWIGNINLEYYLNNRFGLILATQYNRGLTSIRSTPNTTGPLTFVHAFSLSAGLTHNF